MKNPMFLEQYSKIVGAYLRDELNPMSVCACFVGNLLNNNCAWNTGNPIGCIEKEANGLYTHEEIKQLERTFTYEPDGSAEWFDLSGKILKEEGLYKAMERTLLLLKKIHESKGEVVESYLFEKRQLEPCIV